ncbi:T9SS type A sorting domain-containing protein [Moheibacter stercoris]|uniref:Photosystem II stability/assembly factor-like uncharacterized protein n=1 Tax=Moheibacter stercoris TaxID=1628251 RepID=A0ABV2LQB4_9FLAO
MQKIIGFLSFVFFTSFMMFGQIETLGSKEYGRILDITYHPTLENKLYALTQGNHILTSSDNGETWEVLYAHPEGQLENLKFLETENSLSFSSKNSPNSFGEFSLNYGVHIFNLHSLSVIKTFQVPNQEGADRESIKSYAIWESNPDVALIAQEYRIEFFNYSKVYYTTDGGQNWTEVYYSNDNNDYFPENLAISPDDAEKLFIARGISYAESAGGLLISTDAGQTWTEKLSGICFSPISFHPENPSEIWIGSGIGYGNDHTQGLYKSLDGGETWNLVSIPWTSYMSDNIRVIAFHPSNADLMMVLEENEIAKSQDGGLTWNLYTHPETDMSIEGYYDGRNLSFNPFNEQEVFVNSSFYPLFSSDGGVEFERIKNPFHREFGNLHHFYTNGLEHLYFGVQNGFVHLNAQNSEENSVGVVPINSNSYSPNVMLNIDEKTEGRIFIYFPNASLSMSNDHGITQTPIYQPMNMDQINSLTVDPTNSHIIYASSSMMGNMTELIKLDVHDFNSIQTEILSTPQESGTINTIHVDPSNSQNILITQGSKVFKSTNYGQVWLNASVGLEILDATTDQIFRLIQNTTEPNRFVLATSKGIFLSTDQGLSWEQLTDEFTVNALAKDEILVSITSESDGKNFQIKYSADQGNTWNVFSLGIDAPIHLSSIMKSTDFYLDEDNLRIFVGTMDLGVLKITLDLLNLNLIDSEILPSQNLIIYPNPTKGIVNIESKIQTESVEIYSQTGQKIRTENSSKISVEDLPKGVYFLKIHLQNGDTKTQKIIKN